jgi:hypothetical protein
MILISFEMYAVFRTCALYLSCLSFVLGLLLGVVGRLHLLRSVEMVLMAIRPRGSIILSFL